jgi:hypothetical protein
MKARLGDFVNAGVARGVAQRLVDGEAIELVAGLPQAQGVVVRRGVLGALRGAWVLYTVVSAVGLLVSFGIKRARLGRKTPSERGVEVESSGRRLASEESERVL